MAESPFTQDFARQTWKAMRDEVVAGPNPASNPPVPSSSASEARPGLVEFSSLVQNQPDQILQAIKQNGLTKLGDISVKDGLALAAFGSKVLLTRGREMGVDPNWGYFWRNELKKLAKGKKPRMGWSREVLLSAYVLTVERATTVGSRGLLHRLLLNIKAKSCEEDVLKLPALRATIDYKWEAWAGKLLTIELILYIGWLLSYSLFLYFFLFVIFITYVSDANALDLDWFSACLAVESILLFVRIQYYARAFGSVNVSFVDTLMVLLKEYEDYKSVGRALITTFSFMLGGFQTEYFFESHGWTPVASSLLFVVYEILIGITLLNLLVAIMIDAYAKIKKNESLLRDLNRAHVIDELEMTLPSVFTGPPHACIHMLVIKQDRGEMFPPSLVPQTQSKRTCYREIIRSNVSRHSEGSWGKYECGLVAVEVSDTSSRWKECAGIVALIAVGVVLSLIKRMRDLRRGSQGRLRDAFIILGAVEP
ncbi:hypothetical protein BSKO_12083 [Bryopsis sp. KO-2023]|nr:hypothetical protein BSKO_12083 [Bryopsis sp. KO-2023]